MIKVKIIDLEKKQTIDEILFAYDAQTVSAVKGIKEVVKTFTEGKIGIETEDAGSCNVYNKPLLIAARIFRSISNNIDFNKND